MALNRRINNWGLTHSPEFPLFLGRGKMKSLLPLREEEHAHSCTPKIPKTMRKTNLSLSKRQQKPQRNHLPPAVPAKKQIPFRLAMTLLQRCQAAETDAAYSYRLRPLAHPYPIYNFNEARLRQWTLNVSTEIAVNI